jgi:hypothetical protein
LRATPTKLSQNPLLPASANLLVPPCTACIAIAAVITTAACTAIFTATVFFHFPPRSRVACACRLQFRLFCLFCLSAAAPFAPCRLRLCPAPLSPFGPSCSEPRKAKLNRAWPRGPRCPPALLAPPLLLPSLLPPVPPVLAVAPVSPSFSSLPLRCCRSSLFLCRSLLVASACVLLR